MGKKEDIKKIVDTINNIADSQNCIDYLPCEVWDEAAEKIWILFKEATAIRLNWQLKHEFEELLKHYNKRLQSGDLNKEATKDYAECAETLKYILSRADAVQEQPMVRPALLNFANEMEKILKDNDYKTGWDDCDFGYLLERVDDEVGELNDCFDYAAGSVPLIDKEFIIKECVDVANYCMMIADNLQNSPDGTEIRR